METNHRARTGSWGGEEVDFAITPMDPRLMRNRVADVIREAIVAGRLKPGQRVRERDLVAQLGISRSPLREAIRTLEGEGFLTSIPHRGAWVSELSASDLYQMVQVRIMLETYAARLFIENANSHALDVIERQVKQSLSVGPEVEPETNFEIALEFHDLLVAASGNNILMQLHSTFRRHQRRYQYFAFARVGHDKHAMEEHATILDALRQRNIPAIERYLSAHLWRFYEQLAPMFETSSITSLDTKLRGDPRE